MKTLLLVLFFHLAVHAEEIQRSDGVTGKLVYRTEQIDVWRTPHRRIKEAGWFGLFN
jgi:hypothetical protein